MTKKSQNIDLNNDAEFKIEKLHFVVNDIIEHGMAGGDQTARQFIMTAITKSDSSVLHQKLEELLFDEKQKELLKTIIIGLFMQKEMFLPIIKYANFILPSNLILAEGFEEKESLLLVLDSLIDATVCGDDELKNNALDALVNLFRAACSKDSTAAVADILLQRFINFLPGQNDLINNKLIELIKNSELDINPKLVAVDILNRSSFSEFYPLLEDIILNISNYTSSSLERLYMLDVATKALNNYVYSGYGKNFRLLLDELNGLDFVIKELNEQAEVICKRIKNRLKSLNEILNSFN
jgi:hypothetical protein